MAKIRLSPADGIFSAAQGFNLAAQLEKFFMSFNTLNLQDSLLRAVNAQGYTQPTPIQAQAIPAILSGKDVMAAAQTGTGKTAGFTLPLLQLLGKGRRAQSKQVRTLVLTPTRELAAQVEESVKTYGAHERLRSVVVFGGVGINPQKERLQKGADILVATPGRLLDLHQQNAVDFSALEILVLDEADRMLDMGFIHDIRRILKLLPGERQNLMFSATFSSDIRKLAKTICRKPVEIDVAPRNSTVDTISQHVYHVSKQDKIPLLSTLLRDNQDQCLVFSRTKHGADKLVRKLKKDNVTAAAIHGNKSQNQRTKALGNFKANRVQVLVATDIAARGIDIDDLPRVINFDLPNVSEDYVHRIGRTGRAGATGHAMSLVSPEEKTLLRDIERLIKRKVEVAELPAFSQAEPLGSHQPAGDGEAVKDRGESSRAKPNRNRRRRNGNNKPAELNGGQNQRRQSRSANDEDSQQPARPKRRRRSRSKSRNKYESKQNSRVESQRENAADTPQSGKSAMARLKSLFGGSKVA